MDDKVSIKSSDSVTTSGEYEIVLDEIGQESPPLGTSPTLNIANNGNLTDLEKNLTEVITELEHTAIHTIHTGEVAHTSATDKERREHSATMPVDIAAMDNLVHKHNVKNVTASAQASDCNRVGMSIFYDGADLSPEKQDFMKPEQNDTDEEMSDIDQDCTEFGGVTYLGTKTIDAPRSENEIARSINELNASPMGLRVAVSIPSCAEGFVVLHDAETSTPIKRFEIGRIIFYYRGAVGTSDEACFAFTFRTSETDDVDTVFQCHVFRCNITEAVKRVSACFTKAFQPHGLASMTNSVASVIGDNMTSSILSDASGHVVNSAGYEFSVSLEIREKQPKNQYCAVPRDRSGFFKLRCNTDKELVITVKQTPPPTMPILFINRCFGVLLSPGKVERHADMHLLDMVSMGYTKCNHTSSVEDPLSPYVVRAEWKANDKNFEQFNVETTKLQITIGIDLVMQGIQDPVRFVVESFVSVQSQNETRFMDQLRFNRKVSSMAFYLQLRDRGDGSWEVSSIDPSEEMAEPSSLIYAQSSSILKSALSGFYPKMPRSSSIDSMDEDSSGDQSSDGDEPLLSGTGDVPKECKEEILREWDQVIQEWDQNKKPKNLAALVRLGIPETHRNQIWKRLIEIDDDNELIKKYCSLLAQETKSESVIQRDIHRTFPAHKFFRDIGGSGQDALFKVSKAYAVHDTEVGYCQGLGYIAASLLLHMPEEEAFCALVIIMYKYGLRNLYKDNFDMLYMYLYQLSRLIKEHLPKLHEHFEQIGVETHMFASQWFLTLFTARFPLYLVFHILDVFFLDGFEILFKIALTLLTESEAELRTLDFEGVLKYFRVTLPKRCRKGFSRRLVRKACDRKLKKLKQYRDEYVAHKEAEQKRTEAEKGMEEELERVRLRAANEALQFKLKAAEEKTRNEVERKKSIIDGYKEVTQRYEQEITQLNATIAGLSEKSSKCVSCSASASASADRPEPEGTDAPSCERTLTKQTLDNLGPLDPMEYATKQIKELELSLAQTKLELVEAQCRNQDLTHQLNTLIAEFQSNRSSWQPWLTKTINSIQEKVASSKRDAPTFQSFMTQAATSATTPTSSTEPVYGSVRPKTLPSPFLSSRSIVDPAKDMSPGSSSGPSTGNASSATHK